MPSVRVIDGVPSARPTRGLLGHLVDLGVYAPLGAAVIVRERLPELIASSTTRAQNRVALARVLGRLAVRHGRKLVEQRLVPTPSAPPVPAPAPVHIDERAVRTPMLALSVVGAELPIDHYDSLAAPQVVDLLPSLTPAEVAAIADYERSHRGRRTILGKIAQLQG